jgi:hypothetical protein
MLLSVFDKMKLNVRARNVREELRQGEESGPDDREMSEKRSCVGDSAVLVEGTPRNWRNEFCNGSNRSSTQEPCSSPYVSINDPFVHYQTVLVFMFCGIDRCKDF